MGREILGEILDGSGDPRVGPGRVGGTSERSGTGGGTLGEIREGSMDPLEGLGLVE